MIFFSICIFSKTCLRVLGRTYILKSQVEKLYVWLSGVLYFVVAVLMRQSYIFFIMRIKFEHFNYFIHGFFLYIYIKRLLSPCFIQGMNISEINRSACMYVTFYFNINPFPMPRVISSRNIYYYV